MRRPILTLALLVLVSCLAGPRRAGAAAAGTEWQQPPHPIGRILDAPLPPAIFLSPDRQWLAEMSRPGLPPLAELAEPVVKVGGVRLNPRTNGPAREYAYRSLALGRLDANPGERAPLDLGARPRLRNLDWSPKGTHVAFTLTRDEGVELWVVSVADGRPRRLVGPVLNAAYGAPCDWLSDTDGLVCKVVPEDRGAAPTEAAVPTGPLVEENRGKARPSRTFTDLLQGPHDEALFDHYLTSSLDHVALDGTRRRLVDPAVVDDVQPSPDGRFLLVETLHGPYSYQVPAGRFPVRIEVLDRDGRPVHLVGDLPLADDIPVTFGSTRRGPRAVAWRADRPATLAWVEALDEGDAGRPAEKRDALFERDAPFDAPPRRLWESAYRFGGVTWGRDDVALVNEWWYDSRTTRTWILDPSRPEKEPRLFDERNYQDAYADPGTPMTAPNEWGRLTLLFPGGSDSIYLSGRGASPGGVYPFLDRRDLATGATKRLWRCRDPWYESVVTVLDDRAQRFVTRRESQEEPANYFVRRQGGQRARRLTTYADPAPELAGLTKRVIRYDRGDGLELSATLYVPPGHDPKRDGRLPTFFWAYPEEFKDRQTASQVTTPENTFSRPSGSSVLFLLTQGYAVVEGPSMPIVGEGDEEPNDTFVEQLVAGARAAVDHVVGLGVADPERTAIGGHSYGAFTAAHLLAHSDLFRAGVARSGAYNRSLTPFGFQGEQRTYWQATDTYVEMSPFTHAAKIDEPILLVHGGEDSNAGTYPVQSERLYEALKGLGGTVRWVVLPHEDHGYRSREAVGHVHWETVRWLNEHVKRAAPRATPNAASVGH